MEEATAKAEERHLETLAPELLLMLVRAREEFEAAKAVQEEKARILDGLSASVVAFYNLNADDAIDLSTGVITRTNSDG